MSSTTTIVTAFYPLEKSKHSVQKYIEWARNFCQIPRHMVIFTTASFVPLFADLRSRFTDITRIVIKEFDSYALTAPTQMEMWHRQWLKDPEARIHSPELYAVWAIKQECVSIVATEMPFGHDWYVWCDIGIQRDPSMQSYYMTFPDAVPRLCIPGHIHFLEVERIPDQVVACYGQSPIPYPSPSVTLGGGCIAGDRAAWTAFSGAYLEMIDRFNERGWFAGKDQTIYFAMLMEKTMRFRLFHAVRFGGGGDHWMSFPVILGDRADGRIDDRFEDSHPPTPLTNKCYVQMMGGLGNQMFQIATGYAYSRRTGRELILSDKTNCKRPTYWDSFLYQCAPLTGTNPSLPTLPCVWREPFYHYFPIPSAVTELNGYFQSSRYFADCSGEIRALFDPHPSIKTAVATKYRDLITPSSCVVHIRRTDYIAASAYHEVCDKSWYNAALAEMEHRYSGSSIRFVVFSDDLEWCYAPEQSDLWAGREVVFVDEPNECIALHLMSQFNRFIIANSTFSWWATWLSTAEDKTVIAPDRWFGPAGPQDFDDIYEPDWIRLPSRKCPITW
jgi:hypothetical protein